LVSEVFGGAEFGALSRGGSGRRLITSSAQAEQAAAAAAIQAEYDFSVQAAVSRGVSFDRVNEYGIFKAEAMMRQEIAISDYFRSKKLADLQMSSFQSMMAQASERAAENIASGVEYGKKMIEEAEEMVYLYRNFGWNEYAAIKSTGGFSFSPGAFGGKQFWIGESGMDFWRGQRSFVKPVDIKISIPKSFITYGHPNYLFSEGVTELYRGLPNIDTYPGGTIATQYNLNRLNETMRIIYFRY
jgi:hypothetical protein